MVSSSASASCPTLRLEHATSLPLQASFSSPASRAHGKPSTTKRALRLHVAGTRQALRFKQALHLHIATSRAHDKPSTASELFIFTSTRQAFRCKRAPHLRVATSRAHNKPSAASELLISASRHTTNFPLQASSSSPRREHTASIPLQASSSSPPHERSKPIASTSRTRNKRFAVTPRMRGMPFTSAS